MAEADDSAQETGTTVELALSDLHAELAATADPYRDQMPGLEPDRNVSDWGRSERVAALADGTLYGFLYHYWFRVEADGVENVPAAGGALLVANRAGRLPADGAMIAKAVREEHRIPRPVHLATAQHFQGFPGLGMAVTKLGGVSAHPANIHRLLFDERQLVLVFPEGQRGVRKPLRARYRLRRFDGLGFVESAMRARVPIVPVAVLGSEEAIPTFGSVRPIPRLPRLPLTTGVPLPAKFRVRFLEPVRTDDLGEAPWRDRGLVAQLGEDIRALIQDNLFELVAGRRSVWLG
jgi:1-acyl-sn-glycerol-3-phosphate acyltransferase